MNYLQYNLDSIKGEKEELHSNILQYIEKNNTNLVLEYAKARNGEPCLYIQKNQIIYRLNSEFNPSYEAKKWAEQYEKDAYHSVIELFGLGNGSFAREIINMYSEETPILIFEPSEQILIETLYNCDITDILTKKNVFLLTGKEELGTYERMLSSLLGWQTIGFQKRINTPDYEEIFTEEYKEFLKTIQEAGMRARIFMNTSVKFGKRVAKNTILNIRYLEDAGLLSDLGNSIEQTYPVILVSAGPSLDKNIDKLRQAKGKAIIVAVDRAINPLLEHGIIPDMTATIDPNKPMVNYENSITEKIPLICLLESNYEILKKHKAKKLFMHRTTYNYKLYEQFGHMEGPLASGGSVATDTFISLADAGFKTIIMVGQDLAIYGEHTHANGAIKGNVMFKTLEEDRIRVPGNNGEEVETRSDFYHYLRWFSEVIKELPEEYTIVNATEGGALIEGTEVTTLENAIEKYCTKEVNLEGVFEKTTLISKEEGIETFVYRLENELIKMKKETKEALDITYDLIRNAVQSNCQNSKAKQLSKKLSDINNKLLSYDMYHLTDSMLSSDVNSQLSDIYAKIDNVYEDTRKTYDYSKYFYEAMLPAVDQLIEYMEETRKAISNE